MRYLITVSYDGSKFFGFQRLNNEKTVQSELERALSIINKKEVLVKGAGRTDRGVHAKEQKVHFDLDVNIPKERLINAINSLVNKYIRVINCEYVDSDFHARFSVKNKTYKYVINIGEYDPLKEDYAYNYCKELDVNSMNLASKYLIGKHSYKAFVSGERDNYNSEIFDVNFEIKDNFVIITLNGKSFYRYMVRNIVGALILVGRNKMSVEEFKSMIDNDKTYSYLTVPASGLYLCNIEY